MIITRTHTFRSFRSRALAVLMLLMALPVTFRRSLTRRMPAASGHTQEIIWIVIAVIVGLIAYAFFGNGGGGWTWFHNQLNSITQFSD
ncbi:hypothetical protein BXT84_00505 [Sulfobacillus thermotolerans]|uniref:Cardiolipin synthase N-terminal domain-containing protein n=1 Tax=Sulfobacillus thermotolerans TaxID=338644 RepID=A0ABN5GY51_9FIRM|nr:hypothetical protein BXT84_00505 [Sulfobacillus thermotolerans]